MREYINLDPTLYIQAKNYLDDNLGWSDKMQSYIFNDVPNIDVLDSVLILLASKEYVLLRRKSTYLLKHINTRLIQIIKNPTLHKDMINRVFADHELKAFWTYRLQDYMDYGVIQDCLDECLSKSWLKDNHTVLCLTMMYPNNLSIYEVVI